MNNNILTKNDKIDLIKQIRESKVDTIKWMVGIFVAIALMLMGIYLKK